MPINKSDEFSKIAAGFSEVDSFQEKKRECVLLALLNKSAPDSVFLNEVHSWQPYFSLNTLDHKYFLSDSVSIEKKYTYLRTLEYYGVLQDSVLQSSLLLLYEEKGENESPLLQRLMECELKYFKFLSLKDPNEYNIAEMALQASIADYPLALRFKYLLANVYFIGGSFNKALPLYSELIAKNYYRFLILKRKINFFNDVGSYDSLVNCMNLTIKLYPKRCLPERFFFDRSSFTLDDEYSFCMKSLFASDSVVSSVYLARKFLSEMNFNALDSIYLSFEKRNEYFQLDSLKIWERGEYYDLRLQSLFIQKNWDSFTKFLFSEVGLNKKIVVENESDLRFLIQRYYELHPEIFKDVKLEFIYMQIESSLRKMPGLTSFPSIIHG